jgi:KaiC/GvpD/RAD55 family RecA-like ATPase
MERISTGITELDAKLDGGYPEGKVILVTGTPGAGKSIFGLHFLYKACQDGKKCNLIATEEPPGDIFIQAEMLGLDLRPYVDNKQLEVERIFESRTETTKQADQYGYGFEGTQENILDKVKSVPDDTDVVVIDNIGVFALNLSVKEFRDQIDTINSVLVKKGISTLIVMDETAYEITHRLAEYSVYGSLRLMMKENPYTGKRERYIDIPKMRCTDISLDLFVFDITSEGIKLK